jgi:hypothetical protein
MNYEFEEPHFDENYATTAGLRLGGNFQVLFRGLQERYAVRFGIHCPTEHVPEQDITTEKENMIDLAGSRTFRIHTDF